MYCKKCGKFIGTDEDLCYECKSVELMDENPAQPTPQPMPVYAPQPQPVYAPRPQLEPQVEREGNVMTGFGKALAGTIVGYFALVFAIAALIVGVGVGFTGGFFVVWSIAVAGGVISLIFGIQSIKAFKNEKRAGRKPPVPTLVLGICSTVAGGLTLFFALFALIGALTYDPYYDPYYEDYYYYY